MTRLFSVPDLPPARPLLTRCQIILSGRLDLDLAAVPILMPCVPSGRWLYVLRAFSPAGHRAFDYFKEQPWWTL